MSEVQVGLLPALSLKNHLCCCTSPCNTVILICVCVSPVRLCELIRGHNFKTHDDVTTLRHYPLDVPHRGQSLTSSLLSAWTRCWSNSRLVAPVTQGDYFSSFEIHFLPSANPLRTQTIQAKWRINASEVRPSLWGFFNTPVRRQAII